MTETIIDGIAENVTIRDRALFTVDGKDFPWHISKHGPTITRIADDLYTVDIELLLIDKTTSTYLPFTYRADDTNIPYIPVINGEDFPWLCTGDGYTLTFGHRQVPTLRLGFYTHTVDAPDIHDSRQAHTKI